MPLKPPELTGILTDPTPPGHPITRQVAFEVFVSDSDVTVKVSDRSTGIFLGSVNLEYYEGRLNANVRDFLHPDDGDDFELYNDVEPYLDEADNVDTPGGF